MRPNYAQDAPPTSIEVGGFAYPCETDFLVWIDVMRQLKQMDSTDKSPEGQKRLAEALIGLEETVFGGWLRDEDPVAVVKAIAEFSKGYPVQHIGGGSAQEPVYSFDLDLNDIVIAIRDQHGVDLSYRRTEPCHWWEFLLLFRTLSGSHYITEVMAARGYTGKDKELLKRKQACALPPEYTAAERAEMEAFSALFDPVEEEHHDQD